MYDVYSLDTYEQTISMSRHRTHRWLRGRRNRKLALCRCRGPQRAPEDERATRIHNTNPLSFVHSPSFASARRCEARAAPTLRLAS